MAGVVPRVRGPRAVSLRDRDRGQLVHALDARYTKLDTPALEAAIRDLCGRVDAAAIDCVLGFPEGGVPAAYAAARILARPLVLSTRMPHALPNEIEFEEPHNAVSYGRFHYIYALRPHDRVLIVEDEITTGVTIVNALRALKRARVQVHDVLVILAPDDPELLRSIEAEGVRLSINERVPVEVSRAVATNQTK